MQETLQWALATEHILSFVLVLLVIGIGRWFTRQGWPDVVRLINERTGIRKQQVELEATTERERVKLTIENDRLLAEQLKQVSDTFQRLVGEFEASSAIQQTHTNLLIHILDAINGGRVTDALAEKTDFGS